jgi:hypothetical protein
VQSSFTVDAEDGVEISATLSSGKPEYQTTATWVSEASPGTTSLADTAHEAIWVVDPKEPGDDLPPKGRSLFDTLFSVEKNGRGIYHIPFPFTELIRRIDAHLPSRGRGRSSVKQVLIPLGRSLQRHAAAPDYFRFPRVVAAVDIEPDSPTAMEVKDRLFLGYQEKARIIEVISYNNAAGRFEFQVVRDYGPDTTPRVFYARRTICRSCHQNGGPIFPRAAWDETNSNPKIATRLWDNHQDYYGIALNPMTDVPFAIDSATDRANLISAYQLLWREGCGDVEAASIDCRAAAFAAMLQYRLSGRSRFDTQSTRYRDSFLSVSEQNWRIRWPRGLKIPNPDIPNRDPISTSGRVSPRLDPLTLRPPLELWSAHRAGDIERVILGLSEFIATRDVRNLDAYLSAPKRRSDHLHLRLDAACELRGKGLSDESYRVSLSCRPRSEADVGGFGMEGTFYVDGDKNADGIVSSLHLNDGTMLHGLEFSGGTVEFDAGQLIVRMRLRQRRTRLHARLPNGMALHDVEIRWRESTAAKDRTPQIPVEMPITAHATVSLVDEFSSVNAALGELASRKDHDPFSSEPFDATKIMRTLFLQLGVVNNDDVCCEGGAIMPVAMVDSGPVASDLKRSKMPASAEGIQAFHRHCATCHRTDAPFPPNFLYGDSDRVNENLAQCAQRILYRLGMWQLPENQRKKTPMPPITVLHGSMPSEEQWRESDDLAVLRHYVTSILETRYEDAAEPAELPYGEYEALPQCLRESG